MKIFINFPSIIFRKISMKVFLSEWWRAGGAGWRLDGDEENGFWLWLKYVLIRCFLWRFFIHLNIYLPGFRHFPNFLFSRKFFSCEASRDSFNWSLIKLSFWMEHSPFFSLVAPTRDWCHQPKSHEFQLLYSAAVKPKLV